MNIRPESQSDIDAVFAVNTSAFETPAEASLVDALREQANPVISLVAEDNGEIIGHIMFSPVSLTNHPETKILGLAPMAVVPDWQNKGVGSELVRAGLRECQQMGFDAVVVLGHPTYYPRFGFVPAVKFGITSEYDVPDDVFMVLELEPDGLSKSDGTIKYHDAFSQL